MTDKESPTETDVQSQPLVSVVMPTYNAAADVEQTIASVLAQSYDNFELIIVDDASSDHTGQMVGSISELDDRIKLLILNNNSGDPARPRNVGIDIATGEYLAFIDDDDLWHPEKLSLQIALMLEHRLGFTSTKVIRFFDAHEFLPLTGASDPGREVLSAGILLRKNIVATSSVVLRADLLRVQRFSELPRHVGVEDYLLWLTLHEVATLHSAKFTLPLVAYRVRQKFIISQQICDGAKDILVVGEYTVAGKRLGWRRYWYFLTYLYGALLGHMYR